MPALEKFYDIIVVGAGPAGANFARLVDSKKYKVLLLDGSLGVEKVCGGLLSPSAQKALARYDITLPNDVLVSPQVFSVKTIDLRDGYTRYYPRNYLNFSRERFDNFFRSMVPESVTVVSGKCRAVSKTENGFEVEVFAHGVQKYACKYLIGADGASSVIRRTFFKNKKIHRFTAIQEWYDAGDVKPFYSCIFDNDTSNGCSWIFFKDGKMVFGGAFPTVKGREAFEAQKKKLTALGILPEGSLDSPIKFEACQVLKPRFFRATCLGKDGAFLIGEAAGFISASSFEGISFALVSSEKLADAFNKNEKKALRLYLKGTRGLRAKVVWRCIKGRFMFGKALRRIVMKSGITSIKTYK